MKDNFSHSADYYSKYRPLYPPSLFEFIYDKSNFFEKAWDAGTGNGQVASVLCEKFENVYATDISPQQLEFAKNNSGIIYKREAAEDCSAPDQCFDLIVAAQAVHWFDRSRFYNQANRCLKPGGCLAVWVYENIEVNPEIDAVIQHLYKNVLGSYWDPERKIIEQRLLSITFPFEEMSCPEFYIMEHWDSDQIIGYLNSWSAVKHYQDTNNCSPLIEVVQSINDIWPQNQKLYVKFPIYKRMGRKMV